MFVISHSSLWCLDLPVDSFVKLLLSLYTYLPCFAMVHKSPLKESTISLYIIFIFIYTYFIDPFIVIFFLILYYLLSYPSREEKVLGFKARKVRLDRLCRRRFAKSLWCTGFAPFIHAANASALGATWGWSRSATAKIPVAQCVSRREQVGMFGWVEWGFFWSCLDDPLKDVVSKFAVSDCSLHVSQLQASSKCRCVVCVCMFWRSSFITTSIIRNKRETSLSQYQDESLFLQPSINFQIKIPGPS